MNADSVGTFRSRYSPTSRYMIGLQGCWVTSDIQDRGKSMYIWILEEKRYEDGE